MRNHLVIRTVLAAAVVAVVAACGATANPTAPTARPGATTGTPSTGQPAGQVDCAAIKAAAAQLIGIQLMAQLSTPETVESIRDGQIGNLDLDAMLSALAALHVLDGYASPLGDPKAALEFYERAAEDAKALFAADSVTQAAIDAFNDEHVESVAAFLGHQVAISGAIGEAGC